MEFSSEDFLKQLVVTLVDNTDSVKVERKVDEKGVLLTLHVADEDRGKIIGKEGRMREAIRTVLRAAGRKNGEYISFKLYEVDEDNRR